MASSQLGFEPNLSPKGLLVHDCSTVHQRAWRNNAVAEGDIVTPDGKANIAELSMRSEGYKHRND